MKQNFTIIVLFLISLSCFGQKKIEIPNNSIDSVLLQDISTKNSIFGLDNLKESKDQLVIRIWNASSIIEVRKNKECTAQLINFVTKDQPIIQKTKFNHQIAEQLLDTLICYHAVTFPDNNFKAIDDNYMIVEIAMPHKYRIYSYFSPSSFKHINCIRISKMKNACELLLQQEERLKKLINQLKPGEYFIGNSSVNIDHFQNDSSFKSDLYKKVCNTIKRKFKSTKRQHNFPRILLNNKQIFVKDLNLYQLKDIEEIKYIDRKHKDFCLYGTLANHGLVLLQSKQKPTPND